MVSPKQRNLNVVEVQKALSHHLCFSFEDSLCLCMLTSTQPQILLHFSDNICHLGELPAARNSNAVLWWVCPSLSEWANSSLVNASSLHDGGYVLHRHHICFPGSYQGAKQMAAWTPTVSHLPSQQIFISFISLARAVSFLLSSPYHSREGFSVCYHTPPRCLTKAIANTDFEYLQL